MGKHAIITGASRGIGYEVSAYFAIKGYNLSLIARSQESLDSAIEALQSAFPGSDIKGYSLDVSQMEEAYNTIKTVIAEHGGQIDILFNNAGIAERGTTDMPLSEFADVQAINVNGAFAVAKSVAECMREQRSGYIFNLASNSGKRARANMGGYAASKFALVGFSQSLFREMLPYGVKVTSICPSIVATSMTKKSPLPDEKKFSLLTLLG